MLAVERGEFVIRTKRVFSISCRLISNLFDENVFQITLTDLSNKTHSKALRTQQFFEQNLTSAASLAVFFIQLDWHMQILDNNLNVSHFSSSCCPQTIAKNEEYYYTLSRVYALFLNQNHK